MGKDKVNSNFSNVLMGIVVWVTMILGIVNIIKALSNTFKFELTNPDIIFVIVSIISLFVTIFILFKIFKNRIVNKNSE